MLWASACGIVAFHAMLVARTSCNTPCRGMFKMGWRFEARTGLSATVLGASCIMWCSPEKRNQHNLGLVHATTLRYGTEREIGAALLEHIQSGRATRDQLFITTKVYASLPDVNKVRSGSVLS